MKAKIYEEGRKVKQLSKTYLETLKPSYINRDYPIPKWIQFAEQLIDKDFTVTLHRAKTTISKYLYISKGPLKVKVRFSNHKPNKNREKAQDCDYYVGVGNQGIITTEKVIERILKRYHAMILNEKLKEKSYERKY